MKRVSLDRKTLVQAHDTCFEEYLDMYWYVCAYIDEYSFVLTYVMVKNLVETLSIIAISIDA